MNEFKDFTTKLRKTCNPKLDSCFEVYGYLADRIIEEREEIGGFTLDSDDMWKEIEGVEETIMEELEEDC